MQLQLKNKFVWPAAMAVVGILATAGLTLAQTATTAQKQTATTAKKKATTPTQDQTAPAAQKLFIDAPLALVDKFNRESSFLKKNIAPYIGHEIKRTRIVKINFEALKNPKIILNLFPDTEFIATITSISKGNPEMHEAKEWLKGTIEGTQYSRVDLFVYDDYIAGTVEVEKLIFWTRHLLFQIDFLGDSTMLIKEMDNEMLRKKKM